MSLKLFPKFPTFTVAPFRNPGRRQGGTLKINLIGLYERQAEAAPFQFISMDDIVAIRRRLDLSELNLQCAIVVSLNIPVSF